ncbi:MAG: cyanophycinase [Pseudomonadota bacterium]
MTPSIGSLYLIGGAEDRGDQKRVLGRLLDLAGGARARILLLTSASRHQQEMFEAYRQAFASLGACDCTALSIAQREQADEPAHADAVLRASLVFLTGGDQKRLMALVGGTRVERAIHGALRERGACIAGTSAGAAAMSAHMLSEGPDDTPARRDSVHLSAGLGLLNRLVVDQHFSQRQRLGRLLSIVAQNPHLLGVGIDENTALHVQPGRGLEVVGAGTVTLIDGRAVRAPSGPWPEQPVELAGARLHLLPAGTCCRVDAAAAQGVGSARHALPPALSEMVAMVAHALDPQPLAGAA